MELGNYLGARTHRRNEMVQGGVQRACRSEPEAWTAIRTDGWRIPPVPMAGVATASGGVPGEFDKKGDPGGRPEE